MADTEPARELQGDAEGPTTICGTYEAAFPTTLNVRGGDPRSPPKAGSAATWRRATSGRQKKKRSPIV